MKVTTSTENKKKLYSIKFLFNGEQYNKRTNDINQTILDVAPEVLYTEMYVVVKKGDVTMERKLNLTQAKRVFRDDIVREVFINNLLLK